MNFQLLYVSTATEAMHEDSLGKIESSSLLFNSVNSITGLLCFDGASFIQLLEGEEALIETLLTRLMTDMRHKDLETIYRQPIRYKSYGDWAMRCVRTGVDSDAGREMERLLAPTLSPELITLMHRFAEGQLRCAEF